MSKHFLIVLPGWFMMLLTGATEARPGYFVLGCSAAKSARQRRENRCPGRAWRLDLSRDPLHRFAILILLVMITMVSPRTGMAAELPTLGSEDPTLLWLGQQLGFPVRYLALDRAADAHSVLGHERLDVNLFVTTVEAHAAQWHRIAEANGIGQAVFRLASSLDHAPEFALKLQLLALGCLAGRDDQALTLWQEIMTGQTLLPDSAQMALYLSGAGQNRVIAHNPMPRSGSSPR